MNSKELENYLHRHIPISVAMGISVLRSEPSVELAAPLAPNVNHRGTAFGGSIASVAVLAAWSALRVHLGAGYTIVVARQEVQYSAPIEGDFEAHCALPAAEMERFHDVLRQRGRARIELGATVLYAGAVVARMSGRFVAIKDQP